MGESSIKCVEFEVDTESCSGADRPLVPFVTADELAHQVPQLPLFDVPSCKPPAHCWVNDADTFTRHWELGPATALPDGHIAVILRAQIASFSPGQWIASRPAYLITIDTAGKVDALLSGPSTQWWAPTSSVNTGPHKIDPGLQRPLHDVASITYDAERDALLLAPWSGQDWIYQKDKVLDDAGHAELVSGWGGYGVGVVPLHEPGFGYVSLSGVGETPRAAPQNFRLLGANWGVLGDGTFVRWDPATLDLDQDGVSAGEEAALGTSDWRWDSDADGVDDGIERGLVRDPARPEDAETPPIVGWSESTWLEHWRLPALDQGGSDWRHAIAYNDGVDGPVCVESVCTWRDGNQVTVSHPVESVSLDGRWAIGPGGSVRTDLATGVSSPWLTNPLADPRGLVVVDAATTTTAPPSARAPIRTTYATGTGSAITPTAPSASRAIMRAARGSARSSDRRPMGRVAPGSPTSRASPMARRRCGSRASPARSSRPRRERSSSPSPGTWAR